MRCNDGEAVGIHGENHTICMDVAILALADDATDVYIFDFALAAIDNVDII